MSVRDKAWAERNKIVKFRDRHELPPPEDERPQILHVDGELPRIVDEVLAAIATLPDADRLYVRAGGLVRVHVAEAGDTDSRVSRPSGARHLVQADVAHVAEVATRAATHLRFDRRSQQNRAIDCPRRVAETLLARRHWPELPSLDLGAVEHPVITPDGTVIDCVGYHAAGLFVTAVPNDYESSKSAPSKDDAHAAAGRLAEIFHTWPFVDDTDASAAVAAVLTVLVRRFLPAAPMVAITAPTPGTGKSLLADTIAHLVLGRSAAMMALSNDEAENEKRIYSALLAADQLVVIDNVEMPIRGTLLCQISTQPYVQFRPLGVTGIVSTPTNVAIIATGNNLALVGDLRRRTMLVRLDAHEERPERRRFNRDPVAHVKEFRGRLLRDALTIIKAYLHAGGPEIEDLPPYGGFGLWDRMVRRPLVWAGFTDPLTASEELRQTDPDLEVSRALFQAWHSTFGEEAATVAEAISKARRSLPRFDGDTDPCHPDLRDALQAVAGDRIEARRVGAWLRRHRDRIIDGLQLKRAGDNAKEKVAMWAVRRCG